MKSSKPSKSSTLAPLEAGLSETEGVTRLGAGIPRARRAHRDGGRRKAFRAGDHRASRVYAPSPAQREPSHIAQAQARQRRADPSFLRARPHTATSQKEKRGKWTQSTAKHSTAKLFVLRERVDSLGSGNRIDKNAGEPQETAPPSDHCVLQDKRDNQLTAPTDVNANDGPEADDGRPDSPPAEADLDDAPALVILDDPQKFRDSAGNILEIEMRGERTVDELLFYAQDVATRCCSKTPNVRILFTVHHGSAREQKQLATKLLGLENLGTVGPLRHSLGITNPNLSDDVIVVKVGFTEDGRERLRVHNLDFAPIAGAQVLFHKAIILDEAQLSNCEKQTLNAQPMIPGTPEKGSSTRVLRRAFPDEEFPSPKDVEKEFENLQSIHGARYSLLSAQLDGMKATLETAEELHAAQMRAKDIENDMLKLVKTVGEVRSRTSQIESTSTKSRHDDGRSEGIAFKHTIAGQPLQPFTAVWAQPNDPAALTHANGIEVEDPDGFYQ
ncbi:hypothetical protein HDU88_001610 [Geranomyces variabilis]|nr:hypothetical protein HDU88_001610 [Geranomyces variabilis]